METTDITTGTEKVFEELRNMPCPHLDYDGEEVGNMPLRCNMGSMCGPGKADNCPVIEALLVYIPWKREMIEEEEGELGYHQEEYDRLKQRNGGSCDDMFLPDYDYFGDDDGDYDDDDDDDELVDDEGNTYSSGTIIILEEQMTPGRYYIIKRKNGLEEYVGSFVDVMNDDTIRMAENLDLHIIYIKLDTIEDIIPMTFMEMQAYYNKDICGVNMERTQVYTIYGKNGQKYTGEFLNADSICIRMWANDNIERFLIANITKVELIQ